MEEAGQTQNFFIISEQIRFGQEENQGSTALVDAKVTGENYLPPGSRFKTLQARRYSAFASFWR
jgi:hypothetical protein